MSNAAKNFDILATSLIVSHNYLLIVQQKITFLAKILDLSAKTILSSYLEIFYKSVANLRS